MTGVLFNNRVIHEMQSSHQCPYLRGSLARAFGPRSLDRPVNNPLSVTVDDLDDVELPRVSQPITGQDSTDPALPVVILLHGTAGSGDDMAASWTSTANPAAHPARNDDYPEPIPPINDLGWHPGPYFGIAGLEFDPLKAVPGWQSALVAEGFGIVNDTQVDSNHAEALWDTALQRQAIDVLRAEA